MTFEPAHAAGLLVLVALGVLILMRKFFASVNVGVR
jgi:hypothetical protein